MPWKFSISGCELSSFCTEYLTLGLYVCSDFLALPSVTRIPAVQKLSLLFLVAVAVSARNDTSLTSDFSSFNRLYQRRKADFFSLLFQIPHSVTQCTSSTTIPMRFSWYTSLENTPPSFRRKSRFCRHKDERDLALLDILNGRILVSSYIRSFEAQ